MRTNCCTMLSTTQTLARYGLQALLNVGNIVGRSPGLLMVNCMFLKQMLIMLMSLMLLMLLLRMLMLIVMLIMLLLLTDDCRDRTHADSLEELMLCTS